MMSKLSRKTRQVLALLFAQIGNSKVKEDPYHALEMFKLSMASPFSKKEEFIVACVAHDLERSLPCRLEPKKFMNYDEFKKAHQKRSAEILKKVLTAYKFDPEFIRKATEYVLLHELGETADPLVLELRFFDVFSFLSTNALFYLEREGPEKLKERMRWGLKRLNPKQLKRLLNEKEKFNPFVQSLLEEVLKDFSL